MNLGFLRSLFPSVLGGGMSRFSLPRVVLEIEPEFIAGVRLDGSRRPPHRVRRVGVRALDESVLVPHPSRTNSSNLESLQDVVREVVDIVGNGTGRYGLVVPDRAVRVAALSFETLPEDYDEAGSLVRWRMRSSFPFPPEEARVSYQVLSRAAGLVDVLAVAARRSVLAEYEAASELMNGGPMLIVPATIALLPLLPESGAGQMLVHVCGACMTTVVLAGEKAHLWRTRELSGKTAEDWRGEVASETARVLASSRDHLKVEIGRAWLCSRPPVSGELLSDLSRALSCEVEPLTPQRELASALSVEERSLFENFGAPVAGLIANVGQIR